ncbi:DEAD/DEAH box helicase family protein [Amycolatopsis sp. cmx-11-32]|uniref:DEAD/DEAH box helicase family protein n=1 Tax=Amycolatopsis sp. cmx-11-32 TaxID=2785796 RepID=UPI0039E2CF5C
MTDLRPDDHAETRVAAMPEQGRTFVQRTKETADAMPPPTLAQLQDAVDMLTPAETDEIIREGEDIEFGYAALELAQDLLAVGHVQRAIRWLRAAADRDIPGAQGQLDEATRLHRSLTDAVHVRRQGQAVIGIASTYDGGAEDEQVGLLEDPGSKAAVIRSADDTAARIIAETRASQEHARDRLHHATDLLSPKRFTDTALPIVVYAPPGTGKTHTLADIVSRSIARGEHCLVVANSYSVVEKVLRRLDHAAAPGTTSRDNTAENMEAWLWSVVEALWPAASSLDLHVKEALTSWARPAARRAKQSERSLLLAAAVLESAPAAVAMEGVSTLARQTSPHEIADFIGPSGELIHVKQGPYEAAATDLYLPCRRSHAMLGLPGLSAAEPKVTMDRLNPGPTLGRALDNTALQTDTTALVQ